ncbi:S-adenosyl-L-methionine-dependent methyltransferase superfamily protein [Trifolium repens]|nr:S-adenosyl-L-methionine-dependent methyltransferase superfamily protein [Trifolium repens]
MGKREKHKQKHDRTQRDRSYYLQDNDNDHDHDHHTTQPFSSTSTAENEQQDEIEDADADNNGGEQNEQHPSHDLPSKFLLYQQSVQSPKGDISYLQKFFLMYVGGRMPLHLQEDFCGTALLSAEWLRSDPRKTAVGLDLDLEALNWCLENNIPKIGADGFSRISLFHGNVLQPLQSKLVKMDPEELVRSISLSQNAENLQTDGLESDVPTSSASQDDELTMKKFPLNGRDIVCAFNYSCCCLHKRAELVLYFKHARDALSTKGGIFVMDLYGGTSSENKLKLQRGFPNFTYIWEQAEFDIIQRKTRISLHFHLKKEQRKIRHAFSYSWRLWTLPEIRDCLEEAGFRSVHFWVREMPDSSEITRTEGFGAGKDIKYEETTSFQQQDSWNAYIVGVA